MKVPEIMRDIERAIRRLGDRNQELERLAPEKAHAEQAYSIALAKRVLQLKTEGTPATLIPSLAKGDETVAGFKLKLDIATSMYDAAKEANRNTLAQLTGLQSLLNWERAERRNP